MKTIASTDNALYKELRELNDAKGRREQGLFLAEGPHLVREALKAAWPVRYVAVRDDSMAKYEELLNDCARAGAEMLSLSERAFKGLADTGSPQGVLVVAEIRGAKLEELDLDRPGLAVLLERMQDPGNLGTILRTALAVNAGFAVLADGTADPWSQKVVRSSQGAVFHLPIMEADSSVEAVEYLNTRGWHTACGHLEGSDFFKREAHEHTALVIGNEAAGVSPETAAACGGLYKLPMPGPAESLNAAVAAGVMLYDIWRENHVRRG